MENENEDSQQTKRSENGTLCIGQKDSQKDSVLSKEYPRQMSIIYNREQGNKTMKTSKKPQTAIDNIDNLCYNTDMKNKENKMMTEKNMQKTSQNSRTAIDKSEKIVYNTLMKNKENKITKETGLGRHPLTKKDTNMNTCQIVASRLPFGLTNELQIICKVGNILQEMGKTHTQINYLMNVDEDFLTDVLSCYNG